MVNLNQFMNISIKNIVDTAGRFYPDNRQGQQFILKMVSALRKSIKVREMHEKAGTHIPPFLIASIASNCNLNCTGCYARANGMCTGEAQDCDMNASDWRQTFSEASDIGISFIFLAGGEPLLRRDIITLASEFDRIIFPIFTNGTMIDKDYVDLFDSHRNLIPVLSIEGDIAKTDERRGQGVAETIRYAAAELMARGILFGTSIMVTRENMDEVTELSFVRNLRQNGCGLIFFVEYVPVEQNTDQLILDYDELKELQQRIDMQRSDSQNKGMIILSFPGDEEMMGGCLAAGRGFFHINASGGAEPCPFSPYSELNVKEQSLLAVLRSHFFSKIRDISASEALSHKGGCTLFHAKDAVKNSMSV